MALDINPNLPPPSGFYFQEPDGTRIVARTWKDYIANIKRYRENKKIPVGDVRADLIAQLCQRFPALCKEATTQPLSKRAATIKTRVISWLGQKSREQRSSGLDYVNDAQAEARAAVCLKCPLRRALPDGCSSCESTLFELRKAVLNGRRVSRNAIGACDVFGSDLTCATWLSEPPASEKELPANCWRKK